MQAVRQSRGEWVQPVLGPNSSGLGQVFWYTVESEDKKMSTMDLRTLHDWTVRLILRTAPGVDDIVSWGGEQKQFQVQIDPRKLIKYSVSFKEVMERLTANNKQVGGQSINLGAEQFLVRGLGLAGTTKDIEQIVIAERNGAPVYVRDVAQVKEAPAPRFGAVTRDGKEAVLGIALARVNENAKNVVDAVKAKLAVAQAALPKGVTLQPVYDRTELVKKALNTAESSLVEGAILVAVILFLFLGEFRSAIVVVLMCDPRHGLTELDEILLDVIRPRVEQGLKFLVLLTKADKLTRSEGAKVLSITRLQAGGGEVKLFSALKKQGVGEAAQLLWRWVHPEDAEAPAAAPEPPPAEGA